jgi:biotin synthase
MQVARWLILNHGARVAHFRFNGSDAIAGIDVVAWRETLAGGEAFRTSGCPGCNRPFYNERPGGTIYNYARPLSAKEAQQAIWDTSIWGS